MENEFPIDDTQTEVETSEMPEGGDEGVETQSGGAQGGEGEGLEPRISADDVARDTELKILRQLFSQGAARPQVPTQAQPVVDPVEELLKGRTDDDLMTTKDVRALITKVRENTDQNFKTQMRDVLEDIARINFTDYDEVLDKYTRGMIEKNPDLLDTINRSKNPALTAYQIGRSHPDFVKSQIAAKTDKLADKIQKNASKPKTLGARTTGAPKIPGEDKYSPANMSDADFEAQLEAITGRR